MHNAPPFILRGSLQPIELVASTASLSDRFPFSRCQCHGGIVEPFEGCTISSLCSLYADISDKIMVKIV